MSSPDPPPAGRRLAAGAAVLVVYALAVVWLTWPLARVAATDLPNPIFPTIVDTPLIGWALAHQSRALLAPSTFPHAGIYHPTPYALFYGEAGFGAVPYFAPVFFATDNPTLALNVMWLGCTVLTAAAIHAVTWRWTLSTAAGFVAGTTFLAARWTLWAAVPAAPNYAVLQYMPFVMAMAASAVSWPAALGTGVLAAIQGFTSPYIAVGACVPVGALALVRSLRPASRRAGLRLLAGFALAVALTAVAYSGTLLVRRTNPDLADQSLYRFQYLAHAVFPDLLWESTRPAALPLVACATILVGAALRVLGRRSWPDAPPAIGWRHGAFWLAVGMYVSLTPRLQVGSAVIPLPQVIVEPLFTMFRAAHRFGVTALVGGSVLAGVAFAEIAARLDRPGARRALAIAVIALSYWAYRRPFAVAMTQIDPAAPYRTRAMPRTEGPVDQVLATTTGPLLELPVAPNNLGHVQAMYRAIYHRHPLLNGYDGYWPATFPGRMALACRLPDADALAALRRETGVELILVHRTFLRPSRLARGRTPYQCPPSARDAAPLGAEMQEWTALARPGARPDLELLAEDGLDLLFRVRLP